VNFGFPAPIDQGGEMFRRRFFKLMTVATAAGLAPLEAAAGGATRTVVYRVAGFSCVTCATGLDTMLREQKGITSSKSTYPQGIVTVGFDPKEITEQAIVAFLTGLGFTVEGKNQT
jgi:copper chaperone CopZ